MESEHIMKELESIKLLENVNVDVNIQGKINWIEVMESWRDIEGFDIFFPKQIQYFKQKRVLNRIENKEIYMINNN